MHSKRQDNEEYDGRGIVHDCVSATNRRQVARGLAMTHTWESAPAKLRHNFHKDNMLEKD